MKYVLDTNAVAALMKGNTAVVARLEHLGKEDVALPQPVIAEITYGLERLPRSKRKEALTRRYSLIKDQIQRVAWSDDVSREFGRIKSALERRGERIEDFDVAIAAHAAAARCVLVTANVRHFSRIPDLEVEDWTAAR